MGDYRGPAADNSQGLLPESPMEVADRARETMMPRCQKIGREPDGEPQRKKPQNLKKPFAANEDNARAADAAIQGCVQALGHCLRNSPGLDRGTGWGVLRTGAQALLRVVHTWGALLVLSESALSPGWPPKSDVGLPWLLCTRTAHF